VAERVVRAKIEYSAVNEYRILYRGTLFPVRSGELTLGRSSYASIVVNNPLASREHAIIRPVPGGLEVVDLGSKNGTFVNGERLEGSRPIVPGDRVKIGTDVVEIVQLATRDASSLRVATHPGRPPGEDITEGETTLHWQRSLDLAENLLDGCTSELQRAGTAETITRLLDAFFTEVPGGLPTGRDQERIRRIADALAAWNLGSSVDVWRRSLDARLSAPGSHA
jgi:pSer/pThr/pTyr-binding forkhead associated (FHA) protein